MSFSHCFREGLRFPGALPRCFSLVLGLVLLLVPPVGGAQPTTAKSPYSHTFDSPEALAEQVLRYLELERLDELKALPLSEQEFAELVWPEMPAARPERGVPLDYAWGSLHQKSRNALAWTFHHHKGRRYELLRVVFDGETTEYQTFTVHREGRCLVRDEAGRETKLALFGSVLVHEGRYKLFSFVND